MNFRQSQACRIQRLGPVEKVGENAVILETI